MPQFDQIAEIYASQIFWLAVFFGTLFVVVGLGILPKALGTVDLRNDKIADDLKTAEGARGAADALEEQYRADMDKARADAMKVTADAKASAAKSTEAHVAKADKAIATKIDKATAKIADARAKALAEIEAVAGEATEALVAKVSGLNVDAKAARAAVKQELANG